MPGKKQQIIEVDALPEHIVQGAAYSINQANPNSYTHGMFKYPCKFIPEVPRWALHRYLPEKGIVLDPFAGSGTTLLEAVIHGHDAKGAEIDDIAKLITKVKTAQFTREEFESLDEIYEHLEKTMHDTKAKAMRPAIDNLEHWFSENTITKLGRLKYALEPVENIKIRNFFEVCMVSIIKKVSYADDTSPKPYVSNNIKKIPPEVEKEFLNIYRRYKQMMEAYMQISRPGTCELLEEDALHFQMAAPANLAITSPPYINAFDYGRTLRLENLWMGTLTEKELRDKKKDYIGTEKIKIKEESEDLRILDRSPFLKEYFEKIWSVDEKRALVVKKFFQDMEANLEKVQQALLPQGRYMLVIGNSNIRKVEVESWRVLEQLAEPLGFETDTFFSYEIKNPYIRIPRKGQGGKISRDYILVLKKKG